MRNRAKWSNNVPTVPPPVGGEVKPMAPAPAAGVSIDAQGNAVSQPAALTFDPMQYAFMRSVRGAPPEGFEWGPDGKPVPMPEVQAYELSKRKAGATNIGINTGDLPLGKTAQGKVDEDLLSDTARLARVTSIEQQFKPKYLVLGNRLANSWTSLKAKAGLGVSAKDAAELADYQKFTRAVTEDLNLLIQKLTGMAMGQQEAERIMSTAPRAGQNWWDGDDPITFKAKQDATMQSLKMAIARSVYLKRNNASLFNADGTPTVPLDRMPQIMNERGAELERLTRKRFPSMKQGEIETYVRKQLGQEFGIATD
jgi:hypothetical protein